MENKAGLILLEGISASGKSTIGRLLSTRLPQLNYISSGEMKRPYSQKVFGQNLSSLNQEQSFQINSWFLGELKGKFQEGAYLIDTHYTYHLPNRKFVRLTPEQYLPDIEMMLLIESDPSEIVQRRVNRGRGRDQIDKAFVHTELAVEREEAQRLSEKFNKPLKILYNYQTTPRDIVEDLVNLLRKYESSPVI